MSLSPALLKKYNVPGPRYTSYPPAPSWTADIGPADYENAVAESNDDPHPAPLSIYVHLPFCEKLCYFCGCTTFITGKNRSFEDPYLAALYREIDWLGRRIGKSRRVVQFHLGGGTPTFHSPDELKKLAHALRERFPFDSEAEVGIEVDPRVTTPRHLEMLASEGFNRISMGVQDFDPAVQKAVNRIQSESQTRDLVDAARSLGYQSVNIDLIYGLPHQTRDSFARTIDRILISAPDRLAVYSYAHVPWLKKHQSPLETFLPSENEKYGIFLLALHRLTDAGYDYIGMDHFAKPSDELSLARKNRTLWRNFMGYTTKAGTDLFGLGMSAIGQVHGGFYQNRREIRAYEEAIQQGGPATMRGYRLSKDDTLRSRVIQNLLCHAKVVKSEIELEFGVRFDDYFRESLDALAPLEEDGLIRLGDDVLEPTQTGRVFLRNLAMPFDATLPAALPKPTFSKTI